MQESSPATDKHLNDVIHKSQWVSSFLMAHQHMLGYLVPYHGVVDLHKNVRI